MFDVFNNVGLMVKRATSGEQQPWVSSSPIDGSFYFAPKAGEPRPVTASLPEASGRPPAAPAIAPVANAPNVPAPEKPVQVAALSPVQQIPVPPKPAETRGVAVYDGVWNNYTTGSCTKPVHSHFTVKNGVISGPEGGGRITADGQMSGTFKSGGILPGRFWGKMSSSSSGSGGWRLSIGCSGVFTFSKAS